MTDSVKPPRQGRGCMFYGCLTTILVFIGVVLGIYFGTRQAVRYAVSSYTSTNSAPIPRLELPPAEQQRIARELEQRAAAALRSAAPPPISLSETDINVLLAQAPEAQPFKDQLFLRPAGTQLQAHVSLPLDQFPLWRQFLGRLWSKDLGGRYFNGIAVIDPTVTNGAVKLVVKDLLVNGHSLPEDFTKRIKNFDLAAEVRQQPGAESLLSRVQDVQIKDGQIIIQPAPSPPPN